MHERAGDHEPTLHAPGEAARHFVAAIPELQLLEIFLGALTGHLARNAIKAGLVDHDGVGRLELVEVELLRDDANAGLGRLELTVDIMSEHAHGAA